MKVQIYKKKTEVQNISVFSYSPFFGEIFTPLIIQHNRHHKHKHIFAFGSITNR